MNTGMSRNIATETDTGTYIDEDTDTDTDTYMDIETDIHRCRQRHIHIC